MISMMTKSLYQEKSEVYFFPAMLWEVGRGGGGGEGNGISNLIVSFTPYFNENYKRKF